MSPARQRCASVALDEAHLVGAVRYVALNPVAARPASRAEDWPVEAAAFLDGRCWPMLQPMLKRAMSAVRNVKLFKNGRSQAVRIPREFELPGREATMYREGDRLILEPAPVPSLLAVLAKLSNLDEPFLVIEDPAPDAVTV